MVTLYDTFWEEDSKIKCYSEESKELKRRDYYGGDYGAEVFTETVSGVQRKAIWEDKEKNHIEVCLMSDRHLKNCLRMLQRRGLQLEVLTLLVTEAYDRELISSDRVESYLEHLTLEGIKRVLDCKTKETSHEGHVNGEDFSPKNQHQERTMKDVLKKAIDLNAATAKESVKIEGGRVAAKKVSEIVGKRILPENVHPLLETPVGQLVVANIAGVAAQQFQPDNKILHAIVEGAMVSSYLELLRSLNLDSILDELMSSPEIQALVKEKEEPKSTD